MDVLKEAYEKAVAVLSKCATSNGFYAAFPGYNMVFGRDSMITSLGAALYGPHFKETIEKSLLTLARHQSRLGQIPNAVDIFAKERKPHVDYQSIDSTLWFIIAAYNYKHVFNDLTFFQTLSPHIQKAYAWLTYQDMGEDSLLEQQPTTDWQDAFPHRYGHTINTQALWYKVLNLIGKTEHASVVKQTVNFNEGLGLWSGKFYLPYRWKNHHKYHEKGEWFDSLGNLLAIIFDLAPKNYSEKILSHIKKEGIALPVPIKAIYPPIRKGSVEWHDYFEDCEAGIPFHYLNGGIWTFIGGFYVLALIKQKQYKEASASLKKIALSLLKTNFAEWLDGRTGKCGPSHSGSQDGNQAWNAALFILASECLKKKKVLI